MNCHGCKWLDEVKRANRKGEGYCAMVKRSISYHVGDSVRLECDERCELFEEGKYEKRFEK